MAGRFLFPAFLLLSLVELIFEVRLSRRNSAELVKRGAVEAAPATLPIMTALYVLMYVGALAESIYMKREIPWVWFSCFAALYLAAKALKLWAVSSLGPYWTMK
ncbi:MAG TPA: hypothetical protein VLR94_09165, partial [Acidobacteriota bacterium]|nr:hypothetical protein [Acidobacteriota bacterium]